ncbi:MAG: hypothetical protein JRI68_03700 [Deltaproteobacteria bacterium]|nr:hypothetical protein [Deltaproteobacteria bacterium]
MESRASRSEVYRRRGRRLTLGLALVVMGLALGFPVVSLLGVLAAALQEPLLVTAVAPVAYALSWVVLGVGTLVGGREVLRQVSAFNRRLTSSFVGWLVGEDDQTAAGPSARPSAGLSMAPSAGGGPECAPDG